jgi:hypothetical protein
MASKPNKSTEKFEEPVLDAPLPAPVTDLPAESKPQPSTPDTISGPKPAAVDPGFTPVLKKSDAPAPSSTPGPAAAVSAQIATSAPRRHACPKCGSSAIGIAGGMRRCNQCGHSF